MKLMFLGIFTIPALSIIFILTGCTKSHQVLINPSIPIHNSTIGNGLTVAVKVVDTRSSNVISKWQGEFKVRKFTVTSQGDLKEIFTTRVRQGLSMLGFSPKNFNLKYDRYLIIEILNIKSHYQQNPPKMNIQVKADIKATCSNKGKKVSKKFSSRKNRSGISLASFPNESILNDNISEIMGEIFTNPSVISCLIH
jgi:uncharacterized lipoprotein YajG